MMNSENKKENHSQKGEEQNERNADYQRIERARSVA